MKNSYLIFLLVLFFTSVYSQNSNYEFSGRYTPVIKKEMLNDAMYISEITPEIGRYFMLPYKSQEKLNQLLRIQKLVNYNQESFYKVIDYVSFNITTTIKGKTFTSESLSEKLTFFQKNILYHADLGSEIQMNIKFKFKNQFYDNSEISNTIQEGEYSVTVVPESEAEFPGGLKQLPFYYFESVMNKVHDKGLAEKFRNAIVEFTVNEEGQIVDAKITRTSSDIKIDKLLIDATYKMPKWIPAKNSKGIKVKQAFNIPFGGGC